MFDLFSPTGFESSATTPVFVGVIVSWFFTETLGWVFAGLVVPGYLAGVFLLDPRSGAIDVGAALLTYGLAKALDELLPAVGLSFKTFGRERFFLVVLCSLLVRLCVDAVLLRQLFPGANWAFSTGLVLVPLMANACWKTGLLRGVVQQGVRTAVVYLLLHLLIFRYTPLSLAGFQLATENVAAAFLDSPRSYILLLTGAIVAAATNIKFGWDFGGILVPALISLIIVNPMKLAATFGEALVLSGLVSAFLGALRLTPLANVDFGGPRRIVLFFTADYGLRLAFATCAPLWLRGDITELLGFGYLLPTLLAVKSSERGSPARVLLPALEVALAAFACVALFDFAVLRLGWARTPPPLPVEPAAAPPSAVSGAALWLSALALPPQAPSGSPRLAASRFAAEVMSLAGGAKAEKEIEATFALQRLDTGVLLVRQRFGTLNQREGYPSVLIAPHRSAQPLVGLLRHPLARPELAALLGQLAEAHALDALVISGVEEPESSDELGYAGRVADRLARASGSNGSVFELTEANGVVSAIAYGEPPSPDNSRFLDLLATLKRLRKPQGLPESALPHSSLSSPAALASALSQLQPFPGAPASPPENTLALQRLLLSPLLASAEKLPSFLPEAASALGYSLSRAEGQPDDSAFLLAPAQGPRPIAVLLRRRPLRGFLIEVAEGYHTRSRDLGARLAFLLDADGVILNLEPSSSPESTEGMRAAHAAALAGDARAIVVVRELPPDASATPVILSEWNGPKSNSMGMTLRAALSQAKWRFSERPLDQAARRLVARAPNDERPLLFLSLAGDESLATGSLRAERSAAVVAAGVGLPVRDGDLEASLVALGRDVVGAANGREVQNLTSLMGTAAEQNSVSAYSSLARAARSQAVRVELLRAKNGTFLVAVARAAASFLATVAPVRELSEPPASVETSEHVARSLRECAALLASGGQCRAGAG